MVDGRPVASLTALRPPCAPRYPGAMKPRRRPTAARRNPSRPRAVTLPESHNDCRLVSRPLSLVTPDGVIPLAKIGKGMFATVYREVGGAGRVFSVVAEGVFDKEIAADAHGEDPRNPHLPRIVRFGMTTDDRIIYEMPFYRAPFRAADASPASRRAFTILRKCIASAPGPGLHERGYDVASRKLECIVAASASLPPKLVEAVQALHDTSTNYDDQYDFEFVPRNVATDEHGNLVLLDVLYNLDKVVRRGARQPRLTLRMGGW